MIRSLDEGQWEHQGRTVIIVEWASAGAAGCISGGQTAQPHPKGAESPSADGADCIWDRADCSAMPKGGGVTERRWSRLHLREGRLLSHAQRGRSRGMRRTRTADQWSRTREEEGLWGMGSLQAKDGATLMFTIGPCLLGQIQQITWGSRPWDI